MRESVFKLPFKYQGNKSSLSNLFSCPVLMPSVGFQEAFLMFQLKSKSIFFPWLLSKPLSWPSLFAKLCLQPAAQVHRVHLHRVAQDVEDRNPNSLCLRRSQVSRAVSETLQPPVIPPLSLPPSPPSHFSAATAAPRVQIRRRFPAHSNSSAVKWEGGTCSPLFLFNFRELCLCSLLVIECRTVGWRNLRRG